MMAEIVLLASAKTDFDAAFDWYAARSESAARRFTEEIASAIERASHAPDRFGWLDTIHRQARVKRFPYQIIFESLEIPAARHSRALHCLTTVVLPSVHGSPLSAPSTQKKCRMSPGTNKAAYPSMTMKNHASPLRNCPL
jgi:plasmid stabilization system protein ParE